VTVVAVGAGYCVYAFIWRVDSRTVVEGQVYRSAQPSATDLSDGKREYGIRTVINLRGATWRKNSSIRAAREAATALYTYVAWQGSPVPTCELTVVPAGP